MINWHRTHEATLTSGDRFAERVANTIGSIKFLVWQNIAIAVWVIFNIIAIFKLHWDPYPFILLNLVFSWQAANTGPILQMTGNRSAARDRHQAEADFQVNREALRVLNRLEQELLFNFKNFFETYIKDRDTQKSYEALRARTDDDNLRKIALESSLITLNPPKPLHESIKRAVQRRRA